MLMTSIRPLVLAASILLLPGALAGCDSTPTNKGSSGGRMDPTSDSPSEAGGLDLRSADLVAATDRMAADMAQRLDVNNQKSPPRIFVGEIENKTSQPHQNYQVFLQRLRAELNSSGARHGMEFIREQQYVNQERSREYGSNSPEAGTYHSRADYVLTCEIHDLPNHNTNYFLLDYQLVQLRDAATGPDRGAGTIVWENSYEVKFQ